MLHLVIRQVIKHGKDFSGFDPTSLNLQKLLGRFLQMLARRIANGLFQNELNMIDCFIRHDVILLTF